MMKKFFLIALCAVTLIAMSCKKDNDAPFSAKGYWRGNVFIYDAVLVNHDNGTTGIYIQVVNDDTASAGEKHYGIYTVTGKSFFGVFPVGDTDTLFIETTHTSGDLMSGNVITTTAPGVKLPFEFAR